MMNPIPDQAELETRLQQARLKFRSLAAEMRNKTGSAPNEPKLSSGMDTDLIRDVATYEAAVADLEMANRSAKPIPAPTAATHPQTGKMSLDDRVKARLAERHAKEKLFKEFCASLTPKKEAS